MTGGAAAANKGDDSPSSIRVAMAPSAGSAAAAAPGASTAALVLGYAMCSSLLAVLNKYAVTYFPYPSSLTALQYAAAAAGVHVAGRAGLLRHEGLHIDTAKKFLPAAIVFYLAIFTNTNLLKHANVDTFIVFRSSTPLIVAVADTLIRRQPVPPRGAIVALFVILGGAVGYVASDSAFSLTAYSWAVAYLVTITTEMVYIKHTVTHLGLSTWGFVYYNNVLSLAMAPLFWIATGEISEAISGEAMAALLRPRAAISVAASCAFGLAISFFGFAARRAISATAFTVTGVVNKLLTVAINVIIWDKHASPTGLLFLLLTIVGGVLYQQSTTSAPALASAAADAPKSVDLLAEGHEKEIDDDEEAVLIEKDASV